MAGQIIDRIFAFGNGGLLGMADRVSVEYSGSPIVINTLALDFAGVYPTPKMATITVDQFVPTDGTVFDPTQKWLDTEQVTIKCQLGGSGKVMEADGFVDAPSITSSPTDPTKLTFKVMVPAIAFS
jgi:hypothetical protein